MGGGGVWHLGERQHLESALQANDPRGGKWNPEPTCSLRGTLGASFQEEGEGLGNLNRPHLEMSPITSAYIPWAGSQVQGCG